MRKALLLLVTGLIAYAAPMTTEYLYLDIHSDLCLNLPDRNPAFLSAGNIPYAYAFRYGYFEAAGDDRLPFTPSAKHYQTLETSAYSVLKNGVVFAGRFGYRYEQRMDKLWLHNAETNIDIPFYFADSTTGDFTLNGIDWNVVFSYPLSSTLRVGVDLFYNVDEQFKSVFPKPDVRRNDVHIRPAIAFDNGVVSAGLTGSYFQFKEDMETKKYSLEQGRTPIFMRIRGLDRPLLSYAETSEERLQYINGGGLSGHLDLNNILLADADYEHAKAQITDGGNYPVDQGRWDIDRFESRVDLHFSPRQPVSSGLFFQQTILSATGIHPVLEAEIYQTSKRDIEGGIILPYLPSDQESLSGTVSYAFHDILREDTFFGLSHYIPGTTLHLGMDYQLERKGRIFELNLAYDNINMDAPVVYDDLSGWYYDVITREEIATYSRDRQAFTASVKAVFPLRTTGRLSLGVSYQDIRPVGSESRFHLAQTHIELLF